MRYKIDVLKDSPLDAGRREKINSNFYFHTSLWYLKRFYKDLNGLQCFKGTAYPTENKNQEIEK